ncbi:toprim domain-containing protein [Novosphingobium sp.]|uniref:toprim domain-containing protein n=1 Tax=Novosphingobium sp. TaxID=1874826 RepID=UPI0025FB56DC|nr:toprim domain-containing protein [Novosphingobium sp.]
MIVAADLRAIAAHYGGNLSGKECLIPTPGHSRRDRGTAIRLAHGAPDGVLVACYNGGRDEALAVKDMLRRDGFLPARGDYRPRQLTPAERLAIRRAEAEREKEKAEARAKAAENARQRLAGARPAETGHPYLVRKRIAPEGLWQGRDAFGAIDALLVPMRDLDGLVWNLQSIVAGRAKEKLYQPGCRTKGLFWAVGEPVDRLVIGEGVGTVAAVRRATGLPVVAAMTAGNLPTVAETIHAKRPDLTLIIAADDDKAGHEAARLASQRTGALIALPGGIWNG